MTKLTREDIFGPTILPGFNGVGEINLENFMILYNMFATLMHRGHNKR